MEGLGDGMLLLQGGEEVTLDRVLHRREAIEEWEILRESSNGCHCSDFVPKALVRENETLLPWDNSHRVSYVSI